jgi:Fis family transcriptional regulator
MNLFNERTKRPSFGQSEFTMPIVPQQQASSLRKDVEKAMQQYFSNLGDESVTDLYQLVLQEVEGPLLEAVLRHTGSNQSRASIMLGLNRGTLRKKLKQHGML